MEITGNSTTIIISVVSVALNILILLIGYMLFARERKAKINKEITLINQNSERLSKLEPLVAANSPISLTNTGQKLLIESGAEAYLQNNKNSLFQRFTGPTTKFDVQYEARNIIADEVKKLGIAPLNAIKEHLYDKNKDYEDMIDIMSVRLRDIFISEVFDKKNQVHPKSHS